jgi:hypothetical protein
VVAVPQAGRVTAGVHGHRGQRQLGAWHRERLAQGGQAEAQALGAQGDVGVGDEVAQALERCRLDADGVVGVQGGERRQEQFGDGGGRGMGELFRLGKLHCGRVRGQVGPQQ